MVSTQKSLSFCRVRHAECMLIILFTLTMRTLNIESDMNIYFRRWSIGHEQNERREASKTMRTREGQRHAFETAAEREARPGL